MQLPAAWQGVPGQPQMPGQQMTQGAMQQPGGMMAYPMQQFQVSVSSKSFSFCFSWEAC